LFGARAFRLDESRKHELSLPLYDAEMVAVDRLYEHRSDLVQKSTQVLQSLDEALTDEDTYELIVARPNTADAIKKRLAKVEEIFRSVI
jgi:hypothetical protein